jgi:hypothetical protein
MAVLVLGMLLWAEYSLLASSISPASELALLKAPFLAAAAAAAEAVLV